MAMSAGMGSLLGGLISGGSSILGGLLGGGDDEDELEYLQLPDYPEAEGARKDWWSRLQEWGKDPNFGAITPAWNDAWDLAKKKINQYYWGGVGDTGLAGKVKASAARRYASQSPALENQLAMLGMSEAGQISDLAKEESINKAKFGESARTNWLSSLMSLSQLKPSFITNKGVTQNYGVGNAISDIGGAAGSAFSDYASARQQEDFLTNLIKGIDGKGMSLDSLSSDLGSAKFGGFDVNFDDMLQYN